MAKGKDRTAMQVVPSKGNLSQSQSTLFDLASLSMFSRNFQGKSSRKRDDPISVGPKSTELGFLKYLLIDWYSITNIIQQAGIIGLIDILQEPCRPFSNGSVHSW